MAYFQSKNRRFHITLAFLMMVIPGIQLLAQRSNCGFRAKRAPVANKVPSDCGEGQAVIRSEYDPGDILTIRTVVHVVHRTNGEGKLDESVVRAQIDTLNRDFRAPNAAQDGHGHDGAIEFQLASEDPNGNPTNGIVYTENDQWFAGELGEFGKDLVWEPTRYMNIYFTDGEGAGGVVYQLPWEPNPTPGFEGLVVRYTHGQQNDSVITHEVGHYLGLEHTFGFDETCPSGDCYKTGDLLCDTGAHFLDETNGFSCDPRQPCGEPEPVINFMNYTNCLLEFTPEQINRMRCSLMNYRTQILTNAQPEDRIETRWIRHITKTSSQFETELYLTNPVDKKHKIVLKAYAEDGVMMAEKTVELVAVSRRYAQLDQLFGKVAPSHISISGDSQVTVSAGYRFDGSPTVSAHLAEGRETGRSFLLHLGEQDVIFDGIAILNLGKTAAKVTMKPWSNQESPAAAVTLAETVPSRGKALADLERFMSGSTADMVIIEADQPIMILGLRGSKPGSRLPFLLPNPLIKIQ